MPTMDEDLSKNTPTLAYESAGRGGTPLLLVHGYPLDRSMWRPQLDALSDVARVIAPDLRGFGESPAAGETSSMDDYAWDLARLLGSIDQTSAVVCGLSMGGYVAMAFAARYPTAVRGLILANTRAGADSDAAREARRGAIEKARTEGVGAIADAMLPKMLTDATRAARPELAAQVRGMIARQPVGGVTAALRGMMERPDRTSWLSSIAAPTLVITSDADALIPQTESAAMAQAIPRSKLVVIPGAAHLSNVENPDAFNKAVREFLGTLR
jgi:pimeloyl-ACP methyl ester carboxylesterase